MRRHDGSWDRFDDYVIDFAVERREAGEQIAIVTLVKIEGSSPRPLGAQMAVSASGQWVGYLSGGCIERAVVAEALSAIAQGQSRRVRYGRGSKYLDIHLPCGSAIELVFDVNVAKADIVAVDRNIRARRHASLPVPDQGGALGEMVREYSPRRRLIAFGVGPATVHLTRLAQMSGFETILYSPDHETIAVSESGGLTALGIESTTAVPDFDADANSAIVFMFHDHDWERRFLPAALDTAAYYIGAMGSRRTHVQRLASLEALGIDPIKLGRIRGPAGLFSAAKSAPDIAMSILAEIMQIERGLNQASLVFRKTLQGVGHRSNRHRGFML
ncbi:XdhC family protein [Mesorhizobium sp. B2-4-9]|uniref:XdhC family protein n=1 Tax=Mesorhizobium sp. B2-4-9 TaxID=2589940 RepID=UPI0015E27FC0|nr:XdhC family protein [Mesorhizobium sp. B2-4-9]